ncbi:MAG: hypothetical protein A2V64_01830 [Bacteroidetes bacterium RBG_13_43_22]|nr:MAG: hypothetical protein A2V64_01830 [Bacteroidetes bacterium RBG_13_43_22]
MWVCCPAFTDKISKCPIYQRLRNYFWSFSGSWWHHNLKMQNIVNKRFEKSLLRVVDGIDDKKAHFDTIYICLYL